ncbi:MAG: hypothetical protein JO079_14870 [Frankiaceae bacterium]|nr:hypothetical protein [Frankiaceae bacterium]
MLNKVPEITVYFWIIKILCTTVGESFADYINSTLGFGLTNTTLVFSAALIAVLIAQFVVRRYVPLIYWTVVVLISVVGTLLTDNLTDAHGVPLWISTTIFTALLLVVFGVWWLRERTLSIHTIVTTPRESFYWLTVLVTFALGTAAGDWTLDLTGWGPGPSVVLPAGLLLAVLVAWRLGAGPVLSFWLAFILTRPLGANIGDFLGSAHADGGLGLGTFWTSILFLAAILVTVLYLTYSKADVTEEVYAHRPGAPAAPVEPPAGHAVEGRTRRILVISDRTGATPELLRAITEAAQQGPAQVRLVVPNPAQSEVHLRHPERHEKAEEAERVLEEAIPAIEQASGARVIGSVSIRHDPMDAVEETLHNEPVDEIIVSIAPHGVGRWLHQDLPHRLQHFGLPITVA